MKECCKNNEKNNELPQPQLKPKSKLIWLVFLGLALTGTFLFFRYSASGAAFLWTISDGGKWLLPLISVTAVLDSINPCAFSILLLTVAFLFSIGKLRKNILKIGTFYIFGIFLVYLLIGLGILQTLHLFNTPHFMAKIGAGLLIVLGLVNLINEIFPAFPVKLKIPEASHRAMAGLMEKASLPAAFLLGVLVGICEFPCTGGPYLMALGLLHDKATFASGFGYLLIYNLIFILPLVVMLFLASDAALLEKVRNWQQKERKNERLMLGVAMIILGIFIYLL